MIDVRQKTQKLAPLEWAQLDTVEKYEYDITYCPIEELNDGLTY